MIALVLLPFLLTQLVGAHDANFQVDGSGTTNPSKFFWKIMEMFQVQTIKDIRLTYRAVGSSYGQAEFSQKADGDFTGSLNDFGAGDIPMAQSLYTGITGAGRGMVHVPFCLGAIGIFHSIPKEQLGGGDLKLSPCVLAKIFQGDITEWTDAEITADNPGLSVPAGTSIHVGHRTTGSSSTGGTTGYLKAKCSSWTLGEGSTVAWPTTKGSFTSVQGSPGMVAHIAGTPYAIGYLDAGHGHQRGFSEVALKNEAGNWLTTTMAMEPLSDPSANGIAAAGADVSAFPSAVTDSYDGVNLYGKAGDKTWPIVLVSYIYLSNNWAGMDLNKAGLLKAFVDFVTSPTGGQAMLSEFSFNAIPSAMNKWTETWTTIIAPTITGTVTDFGFEMSKAKWVGQGDNMISVKRNSYTMWKVGEMSGAMDDMSTRVQALEAYPLMQVDGSGTTNPSKYFWKIMETLQARTKENIRLTYRAVGSSYGQAEFSQKSDGDYSGSLNDFGAGDIPMKQATYDEITKAGRKMVHVPFCLGAIAIFHSIPKSMLGTGDLKLAPCTLAKIFDGVITEWSDSEIMADNPGLKVPAGTKIQVGHRTTGSSSTGGTTGYLEAKCPQNWGRGSGSTISWPTEPTFTSVEGSPGMTAHIAGTPFAIGYLDAGHGHQKGFSEVALKNEADKWLTSTQAIAAGSSPSENGIAAAGTAAVAANVVPPDVTASFANVNLYRKDGDMTWPIVLVSYIYVAQDWSGMSAHKAGLLKAFVDYVTSKDQGQAMLSEFSFNAVPDAMNKWDETWANVIVKPSVMTDFGFEESKAKWAGMSDEMISVKRNTYSMWKIGEMSDALTDVQARLAMVESAPLGVQVDGSGTTNPSKYFWKIMEMFEGRTKENIRLTYRAVGSSYGMAEFTQKSDGDFSASTNDFGAGDIPMSQSLYDSLTQSGRKMVHVPFCMGAIAVFHSIPKAMLGTGALKLSPCVLAKIFDGVITTWDDQLIKDDNPDLSVPAGTKIQVGHRTTGSSSTGGITGYLKAKAQPAGCWNRGAGSTITWPTLATFTKVQGSPGMTEHIASTPFAIGYLDAGHGHQRGFEEVALKNEENNWLTSMQAMKAGSSPSTNGIAAAGTAAVAANSIPSDVTASWADVNLYGKGGAMTWPIVLVSYMYVHKDWSGMSADKAGLLKAFVDYVTGPQGQGMLGEFSFNAIPDAMNKWDETWSNVIVKPATMTDFQFEESKMKWAGQAQNMISVKRSSYSMWKVGEMASMMEDMQKRVTMLEHAPVGAQVDGSGTTNPSKYFWKIMETFESRAKDNMRLTYRAVGSSYGQAEFSQMSDGDYSGSLNDFGAGDIPMAQSIYDSITSAGRKMVHVPFCMGAIAIFHSVPASMLGGDTLKLSPCVLAKIFDGQITEWDNAEIKTDNPNLNVPAGTKIQVGHRTTGSSSTGGTTGYLNAKCPASWGRGASSKITWPSLSSFTSVEGSPGMTAHIANTEFAIGYLDAGHGHQRGFAEVALKNEANNWLTSTQAMAAGSSPSTNGIAAAGTAAVAADDIPMDVTASWADVNLYRKGGDMTWPIVLVSYIYVHQDWSGMSADKAGLLKAFVDYVTGAKGQAMLSEFSFNAIPAAMNKWTETWNNVIKKPPAVTDFMFEESKKKWEGQSDQVISVKRSSYSMWKINELDLAVKALQESATSGTGSGTPVPVPVPVPVPAPAPAPADEDDGNATVALILSIVACVLGALALGMSCCVFFKGGKGGADSGSALSTSYGRSV